MLVPRIAQHYWGTWDELSIEASILLKGDHICTPPELLNRTLADLHSTHQRLEKMQALASEAVYWPSIDVDITDYVKRCAICTWHKTCLPAQPMLPRDICSGPWQEMVADYFHHSSKDYLLIADLFSKYHFLFCLTSYSAHAQVQKLQEVMSQYGPPYIPYTDNGSPCTAEEYSPEDCQRCWNIP